MAILLRSSRQYKRRVIRSIRRWREMLLSRIPLRVFVNIFTDDNNIYEGTAELPGECQLDIQLSTSHEAYCRNVGMTPEQTQRYLAHQEPGGYKLPGTVNPPPEHPLDTVH